jgi:hypothetical protein
LSRRENNLARDPKALEDPPMKSVAVLGEAEAPGATVAGDELGAVEEPGVTAGVAGLTGGAVVEVDGTVVVGELGRVVEGEAGVVFGALVDGVTGTVVDVRGVVVGVDGLVVAGELGGVVEEGVAVEAVVEAAPASAPSITTEVPIIRVRPTVAARRADLRTPLAAIGNPPSPSAELF